MEPEEETLQVEPVATAYQEPQAAPMPDIEIAPSSPPAKREVENGILVFILTGLHEGASFRLPEGGALIGSSYDCDLILSDDEVDPAHIRVKGVETRFGFGVDVTCEGERALINGRVPLEKGETRRFTDGFVLSVGTVNLRIMITGASPLTVLYRKFVEPRLEQAKQVRETVESVVTKEKIVEDRRNLALIAMSAVFLSAFAYSILFSGEVQKEGLKARHKEVIEKSPVADTDALRAEVAQAEKDLTAALKKYNLGGRLDVKIYDETLYISGSINSYENSQWAKVQNWYDTIYARRVNLVTLISVNNGARRTISFKSVAPDIKEPFVVSWTGERYRPGATLPGGWVILDIRADGVLVKDAVENRTYLVEHIRTPVGSAVQKPRLLETELN